MYYTIGQRQGLGIGGRADSAQEPWFVAKTDVSNNIVYAVQGHQHPALYHQALTTLDIHWIQNSNATLPLHCKAKIRYRQEDQACTIKAHKDKEYLVEFDQPQRAITSGQSIVFYHDDQCLGGAIIKTAIN